MDLCCGTIPARSWMKRNRFFFSSRRRHTSCLSDWSSDVCSSDLVVTYARPSSDECTGPAATSAVRSMAYVTTRGCMRLSSKIGRASCRERVEHLADVWDEPDHGIWERRCEGREYVSSKVMTSIAL